MKKTELKKVVYSETDNTIKYIFYTEDRLIIEFSYINKNDGKDIICVPCQTMCSIGCKFCFATELINKVKTRNLTQYEISNCVEYIYNDLKLYDSPKTLLISYMGIGEIVLNVDNVVNSMIDIKNKYNESIYVRFAFATSLPEYKFVEFFKLTEKIKKFELPVKLHLSLHYTTDELRKKWMPASLNIEPSIAAADFYKSMTGNPIEVHYTLIDNVNDTKEDAIRLTQLIKGKGFDVKFLFFNEKDDVDAHPSNINNLKEFTNLFEIVGIKSEYYIPPGISVGSSCGKLIMNEYIN